MPQLSSINWIWISFHTLMSLYLGIVLLSLFFTYYSEVSSKSLKVFYNSFFVF